MKDYPVRLTMGQTAFLVISLCLIGFLDFYLGARFGPELFWDVRIDRKSQSQLLPPEDEDAELQAILKEEGTQDISFHEELSKKNSKFEQEPVKLVEEAPPKKALPVVKKEEPKTEVKKTEPVKKEPAKTETKKTDVAKSADKKTTPAALVKVAPVKKPEPPKVVEKKPEPKPEPKPEESKTKGAPGEEHPAADPVGRSAPDTGGDRVADPIGKQIEGEIIW